MFQKLINDSNVVSSCVVVYQIDGSISVTDQNLKCGANSNIIGLQKQTQQSGFADLQVWALTRLVCSAKEHR